MLELFFVIFIIPRRVKALATLRDESSLKWSLLALAAWFGTEIVVVIVVTIILVIASTATGKKLNETFALMIAYFLGLAGAAIAATLVVRQLQKKPVTLSHTENISG